MKIDLEKYVRDHRNQLDEIESLDLDQMWNSFDQKKQPIKKMFPWRRLAAAVAVLLIGGIFYLNNVPEINHDELVYQKLNEIDPSIADEQKSMTWLVAQQDSLIKNLGITELQYPELFKEIEVLDSLQMDYLNDLEDYRDRNNLIRTLLRHYQTKTRIFELMLNEYDQQEKESTYENGKNI